jgi:hypothetical protein
MRPFHKARPQAKRLEIGPRALGKGFADPVVAGGAPLENDDPAMFGQGECGRRSGRTGADDGEIGVEIAQRPDPPSPTLPIERTVQIMTRRSSWLELGADAASR